MIAIAIVLRIFLLKKSENIRLIPIAVLGAAIFGLEIAKQVISLKQGYNLYYLPFHFCSMFIFLIPLASICRGKFKRAIRSFTTVTTATLFMFMLIVPAQAYDTTRIESCFTDFFSFHTIAFHDIVVCTFLFIVALELYKPDIKYDSKVAAICLTVFCIIGGSMAQIFKENYNGFYYCRVPALEDIRLWLIESMGQFFGQFSFVFLVSFTTSAFVYVSYFACVTPYVLINKLKESKQNKLTSAEAEA